MEFLVAYYELPYLEFIASFISNIPLVFYFSLYQNIVLYLPPIENRQLESECYWFSWPQDAPSLSYGLAKPHDLLHLYCCIFFFSFFACFYFFRTFLSLALLLVAFVFKLKSNSVSFFYLCVSQARISYHWQGPMLVLLQFHFVE